MVDYGSNIIKKTSNSKYLSKRISSIIDARDTLIASLEQDIKGLFENVLIPVAEQRGYSVSFVGDPEYGGRLDWKGFLHDTLWGGPRDWVKRKIENYGKGWPHGIYIKFYLEKDDSEMMDGFFKIPFGVEQTASLTMRQYVPGKNVDLPERDVDLENAKESFESVLSDYETKTLPYYASPMRV
jgi:hypothetical protein